MPKRKKKQRTTRSSKNISRRAPVAADAIVEDGKALESDPMPTVEERPNIASRTESGLLVISLESSQIRVEASTHCSDEIIEVLRTYWEWDDGNQNWKWPAKDAAEKLGIPVGKLATALSQWACAYIVGSACPECGNGEPVKNRSSAARELVDPKPKKCWDCVQRVRREDLEDISIWCDSMIAPAPVEIPLLAALAVKVIFIPKSGSPVQRMTAGNLRGRVLQPLIGPPIADCDLVGTMVAMGIMAPTADSPQKAFKMVDGELESWYPLEAFYMPGSGVLELLAQIETAQEIVNCYGIDEVRRLWVDLAVQDAMNYLDGQLAFEFHDPRPPVPEHRRAELEASLLGVAEHFSIGQLRNLCWRSARDAIVWGEKHGPYLKAEAVSSCAATSLIRNVENAQRDRWKVNHTQFEVSWHTLGSVAKTFFELILPHGSYLTETSSTWRVPPPTVVSKEHPTASGARKPVEFPDSINERPSVLCAGILENGEWCPESVEAPGTVCATYAHMDTIEDPVDA
ncbi:hypothetical protein [Spongiactinospora sp. TRM90649]|uniref:hypothetical protein n=1 Tax=Spongiactinospora sp. TRM90649 TaxID=3031114 RepID=UPI0023F7E669|nr:hypothetical protein [Spongiactinospora sp. TRM90649]MDF5758785.1 hypothetical protein [Spongiactinospora sp. TRM90649]